MVSRYVPNFTLGLGPGNPNGHPPSHVPPMPLGVAMAATAAAAAAAAAVPLSTVTQSQPLPPSSQQSQVGGGGGQPPQQPPPTQAHATQPLKGQAPQSTQTPAEYHVQQCLMPTGPGTGAGPQPQHQHYRILHSRSDGYVAASSAGFSAPQSGPPHQGPPVIRGMQSAPPPTPPQQDLSKMQQPPQSIYVPTGGGTASGTVRPSQQTNIFRNASTAAPRAPRHVAMSQMYSPVQPVVMSHFYPHAAPPRQPTSQMYTSGPQYHFSQTQLPTYFHNSQYFLQNSFVQPHRHNTVPSSMVPPGGPALAAGPGASQAPIMPNVLPTAAAGQPGTGQATGTANNAKPKRRKHALDIIDPHTKKNVLDDIEMQKSQSVCNTPMSNVDYQEQVNLPPGNGVLGGGTTPIPQIIDPSMNADPNYNNKTLQGMAFIDMMQHHKISATPAPCQTQTVNQVNEMIGPTTPIVSAMSDGPSVEIHPKQLTKKKSRAIEPVPPPPAQSSADIKNTTIDSSKTLAVDSVHVINTTEGTSEKSSQQITATNNASLVNRNSEDSKIPINKAINNRSDSESSVQTSSTVYHPTSNSILGGSLSSSSNIDSRDSTVISGGNIKPLVATISTSTNTGVGSSSVILSNQQQSSSSTQQQVPQPSQISSSSQQQQSQTQPQHHQQQSSSSKRDTKPFQQQKITQQQQQHSQSTLPSLANNSTTISSFVVNNSNNSNSNNTSSQPSSNKFSSSSSSYSSNTSSQTTASSTMPVITASTPPSGNVQQQQQQHQQHHHQQHQSAGSKQQTSTDSNSSNTAPSTKSHKGKDKGYHHHQHQHQQHQQQQQQQQAASNINNNNSSGIEVASSSHEKQNSINNNIQQTQSNNKAKFNEKDDNSSKQSLRMTTAAATQDKDTSVLSHRINHEMQSLDETDRIGITTTPQLVDEVNNYCNNNDKLGKITADNANNISNNNNTIVKSSTSKSLPQGDKDNSAGSNSRPQQKTPSATSKDNVTKVTSNVNNMKNETKTSETTEMTKLPPTTGSIASASDDKLSSSEKDARRGSNSFVLGGGSSSTATIINGTTTGSSALLSPQNSTIETTKESSDAEKSAASVTSTTAVPVPSFICYNEGQWSPSNPDGAKVYNRQQLLGLRNSPAAQTKVANIKCEAILQGQGERLTQTLLPSFAKGGNNQRKSMGGTGNMSLGGGNMSGSANSNAYLKQASMSGVNAKNSSKGSKSGMIHLSLSLREDVKLNETENAWRPTIFKQNDNIPPEERAKEELFRKVRGILNKLTPEKFDTLVDQIMKLQIDTKDKVNGVMVLVFEKAIDEPNFSASYAKLCQRLADNKLQSEIRAGKDGDKAAAQQKASNLAAFKNALLDKTEREFKDNVSDCQAKERKLQPIIEKIRKCTDEERKLELTAMLEEEERKIRRRSGGTVRFIGELFKISMLTGNIIRNCIEGLLDPTSEDKLECLCKLLTTVGKKFESTPISNKDGTRFHNLDEVITKMKNIVDRKVESKISSRVRFMLQDVIDLRKNKWVSTKTDVNPKTMDQIQKEAKTEQMSSQFSNYNLIKKDDRRYGNSGGGSSGSGGGGGGGSMSFGGVGGGGSGGSGSNAYYKSSRQQQSGGDETWHIQTSKNNRAVDTTKLGQIFSTDLDSGTKLGGMSKFQWAHTSGGSGLGPTTTTSNSFAPLSSLESSKSSSGGGGGPRNKGSYNKGSMERDRYGSAHGSRESSTTRSASTRGSASDRDKDRDSGRGSMQRGVPPSHHSYTSGSSSNTVPSRSNRSSVAVSSSQISSSSSLPQFELSQRQQPPQAIFEKPGDDVARLISLAVSEMIDIAFEESFANAVQIINKFPEKYRWYYIFSIFNDYLHSAKVKPIHRKIASEYVLYLLKQNIILHDHFSYAYKEFSELADDLVIDVPALWQYIFQFVGPLVYKNALTIKDIWNSTLYEKKMGNKFLKEMILYFIKEVGPNYTIELWRNSNLKWTDFIPADDVEKFIEDNKFEFIDSEDAKAPVTGTTDMQRIRDRLKELLNDSHTVSNDAVIDYLDGNIVNIDKPFIRTLTETLCEFAINNGNKTYKLDQNKFQKICMPLLQRYLDSKEERELECLYAIQLLINRLEHPSGLLNDIFGEMYDADVVPAESYLKWRDSKEEPSGKGVAVKGLTSFFNNILSGETSEENN